MHYDIHNLNTNQNITQRIFHFCHKFLDLDEVNFVDRLTPYIEYCSVFTFNSLKKFAMDQVNRDVTN